MDQLNETIVENVHLGLAVLDTSLNILRCNERFSCIFAPTRDGATKDRLRGLGDGEILEAAVVRALSNSDPRSDSGYALCIGAVPDRRSLLTASRIKLSGPGEGILITLDELTERRLQQLQEMEANRPQALDEIVGDMAHEINNPLAAIMGFAQLALQRDLDPVLREYLKTVHTQAQKASGLIAELQSLARESKSTKGLPA